MSKILYCSRCSTKVGEMSKGKILKTAVHLCERCNDRIKTAEGLMEINKTSGKNTNPFGEFGDVFGDLFGTKK